jgi:cytochrome c peroxidase
LTRKYHPRIYNISPLKAQGYGMAAFLIFLGLINFTAHADALDTRLAQYTQRFGLSSIKALPQKVIPLYDLGRRLFFEPRLSLAGDISCAHCHHPHHGSGDTLPLSIGTGGLGHGQNRRSGSGKTLGRNAPHLYVKAMDDYNIQFWDGRVQYNPYSKFFTTPEPALNGLNPARADIAKKLSSAAAAQALFPMVNRDEMVGPLHDGKDNFEIWEEITTRVLALPIYQSMFTQAFPGESSFSIAHIANALAYYEKYEFWSGDTAYDRYFSGDLTALSEQEKRGALAFIEKGMCVNCHNGKYLTNFGFESALVPPVGATENPVDTGREQVDGQLSSRYRFIVPPLRNIALTAPYMHNGAFSSLREVIEHYRDPVHSLYNYDITNLFDLFAHRYQEGPYSNKNTAVLDEMLALINSPLPGRPPLTDNDVEDLLVFLQKSLTSDRLKSKLILR